MVSQNDEMITSSQSHRNLKVDRVRGVDTHLSRIEDFQNQFDTNQKIQI